jgi:hypothetical protein
MKRGAIVAGSLGPLAFGVLERSQPARETDEVGDRERCAILIEVALQLAQTGTNLGYQLASAR